MSQSCSFGLFEVRMFQKRGSRGLFDEVFTEFFNITAYVNFWILKIQYYAIAYWCMPSYATAKSII